MLPTVKILGHFFHLTQAVWRKVQGLGLQAAYTTDNNTHKFTHKLLCFPYLPAEHIQSNIIKLQDKMVTQPLQELTAYIHPTWFNNPFSPTNVWSVFGHFTRANNDVYVWHHWLNKRGNEGQLPFYALFYLLHNEVRQFSVKV